MVVTNIVFFSDDQDECNVEFSTAKMFTDHMTKVHSLKPWLCQICSKRFKERQNFQYHSMMVSSVQVCPNFSSFSWDCYVWELFSRNIFFNWDIFCWKCWSFVLTFKICLDFISARGNKVFFMRHLSEVFLKSSSGEFFSLCLEINLLMIVIQMFINKENTIKNLCIWVTEIKLWS